MKEILAQSIYWGTVITLIAYQFGIWINKKFKVAILNPLLIAIVAVILFLLLFNVEYDSYRSSTSIISYLLTPATVALAVPLYEQVQLLKKNLKAILAGITAGVLTSAISILTLSWLLKLNHQQYVTLLPKSITTAIGMGVSEELGGIPAITVAVIIITGVLGYIMAEFVLKIFHIEEPIAKGIAIGTSAHAIGTARAMEIGEVEGAMSSLAIAVSGLMTVVFVMFFANLL